MPKTKGQYNTVPANRRRKRRASGAYQRIGEAHVERAIRGAEIVRILAALSEDVSALTAIGPHRRDALAHLSDAAVSVAALTKLYTDEAVRVFQGVDCLPVRAAVVSAESAQFHAHQLTETRESA